MLQFGNGKLQPACIETPPLSFTSPFRRRQVNLKQAQLHNSSGIVWGILDTKKNFRKSQEYQKTIDKFENLNSSVYRILNSSLNTHPTFWQHFTGKKTFKKGSYFFVFLSTKRGHSALTWYNSVQSTVHRAQQISSFSESSTLQLISAYSPKGALAIKKE